MNSEELNELLNGLLDGVLTDEEQKRLDAAMKDDPGLEARLSEMQALRRSLLRGRSVGRLGTEFSKQVVAESRRRAEMMGDRAPEWLRPTPQRTADRVAKRVAPPTEPRVRLTLAAEMTEKSPSMVKRAWRVWIPTLALAAVASITLYYSGSLLSPRMTVEPLMSNTQMVESPEKEQQKTLERATDLLNNQQSSVAKSEAPSASGLQMDVASKEPSARLQGNRVDNIANAPLPNQPMRDSADEAIPRIPSDRSLAADSPEKNKLPPEIENLFKSKGIDPDKAVFTFVAEVVVSSAAKKDQILQDLLEEHEIVYTDDVNLSDSELDSLVSSQMVGMMAGVDAGKRSNEVQVYFVRAKASKIDSFLVDVQSLYEAFPKYHVDMSFDPSVLKLVDQLRSIITTDDTARRLTFRGETGLGLVTSFPAGDRSVEYIDIEKRKREAERLNSRIAKPTNMNSYMLLLVKNAEESN